MSEATNGHTSDSPQALAPRKGWTGDKPRPIFPHPPTGHAVDIHRAPPHSVEAEQGVLGSMLLSRDAISECVDRINEEHFYVPAHQTIYSVLVDLYNASQVIDLITFTQVLRDRNLLETVGGASAVTSLFTFVPTAANIGYYIEILRDKYILRSIIAAGTESVRRAYEEQDEVNLLLDDVQAKFTSLAIDREVGDSMRDMGPAMERFLERLENAFHNRGAAVVEGLSTGFYDLDRMTSGLKRQQLITIAGITSHGKTSFATNIAEHVAFKLGRSVGIWSMEMSYDEEGDRICCSMADVPLQRLRDGFLSKDDFTDIPKRLQVVRDRQHLLHIDDQRGLAVTQFCARVRREFLRKKLELVIADHLQFLSSTSKRAQDNRAREISEITYALKGLAKELNIPIILISHVSREADKRASVFRRPKLSDLKESSSIEQDSDVVIFVWRPGRFVETDEDRAKLARNLKLQFEEDDIAERDRQINEYAELIVAKQRNGPVGEIRLRFESDITKFQNVTIKSWSNKQEERQQT